MFTAGIRTSKTYQFAPANGEIVLQAFGRLQIRPSEITQAHMWTARMCLNEVLSELSNLQPNLWEVGLQQMPLTQGVATYSTPAETVMVLDLYLSYGTPTTDIYLYPISRTEYASYVNKTQQGRPSVYWYDRTVSQNITFYFTPDGNGPYVAKYYSVRQTQDADVAGGQNPEIPYRFYNAFIAGMAWMLSQTYRPDLEDKLFNRYTRALSIAQTQDTEAVTVYITPGIGGYYRP